MTGKKVILGCMLCVMAFSAFAVQGATAATKGTTAFTCKNLGPGHSFKKAHCKNEDFSPGNGEYEHISFAENTTTDITLTNAGNGTDTKTTVLTKLKSIQSGIEFEIQAAGVHGEGWLTNAKDATTGEHYVHGQFIYKDTGVTVTKPAGKGCKVKGESFETKNLNATTLAQAMGLKVSPAEGELLATFEVEGCSIAALNGAYELKGSAVCVFDGATCTFSHTAVTEQNTLKLRGQKAGVDEVLTIVGKDTPAGDKEFTPLSFTTVETP